MQINSACYLLQLLYHEFGDRLGNCLSFYYEGTQFDMTKGVGAGPFGCIKTSKFKHSTE